MKCPECKKQIAVDSASANSDTVQIFFSCVCGCSTDTIEYNIETFKS